MCVTARAGRERGGRGGLREGKAVHDKYQVTEPEGWEGGGGGGREGEI